jgi:hypothetical protein
VGRKAKKRRETKARRERSTLGEHQRVGKKLVPPFNRLPAPVQRTRWSFDRMPEVLWACLVRSVVPRADALRLFRRIVIAHRELLLDAGLSPEEAVPTHTNLATKYPQLIPRIVQIVGEHPLGYAALRILLMFDGLPARDAWEQAIRAEPQSGDSETLADAVAEYLWHQSEPATDVRWLCLMCAIVTAKMYFPEGSEEMTEGFRLYPDHGDLRSVRPSIRALEQTLWVMNERPPPWADTFWEECRRNTPCLAAPPEGPRDVTPPTAEAGPILLEALYLLSQHWVDTAKTTDVDAKHEGFFAFVLYALRCLLELVGKARVRIAGRLLLRTIVECRITLAYLVAKNDDALWSRYRHFGSGQAKLSLLKISEAAKKPHSVSVDQLERIANEDVWDEFVDINLGNWAGADLRKMAEESKTKDMYDAHYGWSSGFAHGQWASVRDSSLTTCLNPLHRLHRVPLVGQREFGDAFPDALDVVEAMVRDLLRAYPGVDIDLRRPVAPSSGEKQGANPTQASDSSVEKSAAKDQHEPGAS